MGRLLLVEEVTAHLSSTPRNVRDLVSSGAFPTILVSPDVVLISLGVECGPRRD